ncbi:hypothetical protein ACFX2I_031544 [Malus domestica]
MRGWLKDSSHSIWENENSMVRSLVLLLKCLKIIENAIFLSKENQVYVCNKKNPFIHMSFLGLFTFIAA